MKRNLLRLTLIAVIVAAAFTTFSSFIATDEGGDGSWKHATGGGCTAYCYWKDNTGTWRYIAVAGTFTDCPNVTYESSCSPVDCTPVLPCSN